MQQVPRVVLVCALLLAGTAHATTLLPMSGQELTQEADLIVVGRCTEVTSRWFDRSLVTLVTVAVGDNLKGDAATQITVAVPGGVDPDRPLPIAVTVPGAPVIAEGDDLLLFLDPVAGLASTFQVLGLSQGAFPIVADGDKTLVVQDRRTRAGALPLRVVKERIASYLAQAADAEAKP